MKTEPVVGILIGSASDLEVMQEAGKILRQFGVPYEITVTSAHRSPKRTQRYVEAAPKRGMKVLIAGAGGAAHLAGAVAALTTLPVIGVPIDSALNGLDSLLSTVQMPAGVPVATVTIGKTGAKNAGILATQILALEDGTLQKKLEDYKKQLADEVAGSEGKIRSSDE